MTTLGSAATRMLLASDGSTTLLLESLLDQPLSVRVTRQRTVVAGDAPERAATALGMGPCAPVVHRSSELVTDDDEVVSLNTVVFARPPAGWSGSSDDSVPLGRRLRSNQTLQYRSLLSSGGEVWPGEGRGLPCAFKEYLIHCEDGSRLYVHERFNPSYVAAPGSLPAGTPAHAARFPGRRRDAA
ncbi:hypothetical protein N4G70_17940 [Streptomyces sp. ASQP_92]|uniref:hypothetical protein n=1 Tax=unclassified Streptomyces TaxID=2593676 RepID=UPI0021BF522D|nr:hypothetical protein [Streptomyces sp. ASQP_92]MCT9090722.1 hypothetical protein [Streptomyces sp. ASQP_92]